MKYELVYLFQEHIPTKIKGICISAGAAKGFNQLGALHYLDSISQLNNINLYSGTSVGAAIACMLACGYKPIDFFTLICTSDINQCFQHDISLSNFLLKWGAIDISKFKFYIEKCIIDIYGKIPTFEELYFETGNIFICNSWCINPTKPNAHKFYFNYIITPTILISDAVLASCALPGIFTNVSLNGFYFVDGGLYDRLIIEWVSGFCKKFDIIVDHMFIIDAISTTNYNEPIQSVLDYLKHIIYIPFYIQQTTNFIDKIKTNPTFKYIPLYCSDSEVTLSLTVQNRIKNFCEGLSQTKDILQITL